MALETIPAWTIAPDWADPVTEGLEWRTNVFTSRTYSEQRQSTRLSPRRYLEFSARVSGGKRRHFDSLMTTAFQTYFYMPVWFDIAYLNASAAIGDTTITAYDVSDAVKNALIIMIVGDQPYEYDIAEVTSTSVAGNAVQFNLGDALTMDWREKARVYAVAKVSLNAQPSVNRLSSDATEATVRLDFHGPNDWAGTVSLPTYRDFPVVVFDANDGDTQGGSYFRNSSLVDNLVGLDYVKDLTGLNFAGFQNSAMVVGRANADDLRSLLYMLRGRASAVWFVYPMIDFVMSEAAASGATEIVVDRSGFTDYGGPQTGRQDIRILLRDGTSIYRRITSASVLPNGTQEALTIDSALTAQIRPESVAQISFMGIGRLDQDLVEISHLTDEAGAATVSLSTRMIPNTRTGDDWAAQSFPLGEMGNCGPTVAGRFWARRNDGPWNGDPTINVSIGEGGVDITSLGDTLFPAVGFNSGFDFSQPSVTANFGFNSFSFPVPYRAEAWDPSTIFDSAHTWSGITLSGDNLSASVGSEDTGPTTRATTSTADENGFRYLEVTVNATAQNNYFGFVTDAFPGSLTAPTGTVMVSDEIFVNGSGTGLHIGAVSAGDVIGLLIYSGGGL